MTDAKNTDCGSIAARVRVVIGALETAADAAELDLRDDVLVGIDQLRVVIERAKTKSMECRSVSRAMAGRIADYLAGVTATNAHEVQRWIDALRAGSPVSDEDIELLDAWADEVSSYALYADGGELDARRGAALRRLLRNTEQESVDQGGES